MIVRNICPLFKSKRIEDYYQLDNNEEFEFFIDSYYGKNSYQNLSKYITSSIKYKSCKNCKLIFQENILSDNGMFELYENIISTEKSLLKRLNFTLLHHKKSIKFLSTIFQYIKKKPSDMTVIDVGMDFGYMLSYAKALGCIKSYGIELSEIRIKYAKDTFGIDSYTSLEKFNDKSIDIINQALEHIPNVREILNLIEQKLVIGGMVYLTVPDGSQKKKYLSKGAFQPLEHINSFSPHSRKHLFSKNMKFIFLLKNLHPNYRTSWLFKKIL